MVGNYLWGSSELERTAASFRACRSRRSGAPAVELKVLEHVSGSGEAARLHREARGGVESPESAPDFVGTEGARGGNWGGLGRASAVCQRGNIEETWAFKPA